MNNYKITSYSESETVELAQNIESEKFPNMVICLIGDLGSGKTMFTKGFASSLEVKEEITAIYHENRGRYGYRRITMELHNRGFVINHKTVLKLMKKLGLQCFVRVKKYRSYKGEFGKICDNLLKRDFKANKPNQKWVTDVTEFSLFGSKLYLSPIIDLFNGEVVSYNISERPVFHQVMDMLEKAFEKTNYDFSKQNFPYTSSQYKKFSIEILKDAFDIII